MVNRVRVRQRPVAVLGPMLTPVGEARVWFVECPCGGTHVFLHHAEAVAAAHEVALTHALEDGLNR